MNPLLLPFVHLLAKQAVQEHRANLKGPQLRRIFMLLNAENRKKLLQAAHDMLDAIYTQGKE